MLSGVVSSKALGLRFSSLSIINREGKKILINYEDGQTLFSAVEGTPAEDLQGRCRGNMACGGCHVILPQSVYTAPDEDETEVVSESPGFCATSRLACQLELSGKYEGVEIQMGPLE